MSHCTKFDFQYTSRKIICRTFQSLGLEWYDGIAVRYGSTLAKKLDLGRTDETPAIIAEKNGFHLMMLNKGSFYELFVEKHNMTISDGKISKEIADEFQRMYIQEVSKEIVQRMNAEGKNAIVEQLTNGYQIRFGQLYDKSISIRWNNDKLTESVQGWKGKSCIKLTEALENMLSSPNVELQSEWTEEYYTEPENEIEIYNMEQK